MVAAHEDDVARHFANDEGDEASHEVDPEVAKSHRDDAAENGHPSQQPAPIPITLSITYALLHPFRAGAQIAHQPFFFSKGAYPVVDHTTDGVAQRGCDEQSRGTDTRSCQSHHDHLRRKRQHRPGKQGGNEHAKKAVVGKELQNGVHENEYILSVLNLTDISLKTMIFP